MNIYKLNHPYIQHEAVYLSTDMERERVADIYAGFEFYIELNTRCGNESVIDESVAAYLLCSLFGCTLYDKSKLPLLDQYDSKIQDIAESEWIDLYEEREARCVSKCEQYIQKILSYTDTEFIRKLCAYFNNEEMHTRSSGVVFLSPSEIIMKY